MMKSSWQSKLLRVFNSAMVALVATIGMGLSGCSNNTTKPATESHDHDHGTDDHAHSHRHGEHGGEIAVLEPGDYDLEWSHNNEDGTVTMFVDAITSKSMKVDSIEVNVKVPDQKAKTYELAKQDDGSYSIKDAELATAIDASGDDASNIQAVAVVVIDGKESTAKLKNMHHH